MPTYFYHPDRGYWESLTDVAIAARPDFPSGTVAVPQRPSDNHDWDGEQWQENAQRAAARAQQARQRQQRRRQAASALVQALGMTEAEVLDALRAIIAGENDDT